MAKNKLNDLNDHLYMQIERLNEEGLAGEKLQNEINRSKVMAGLASQVVNIARVVLDAEQMKRESGGNADPLKALSSPPAIEASK